MSKITRKKTVKKAVKKTAKTTATRSKTAAAKQPAAPARTAAAKAPAGPAEKTAATTAAFAIDTGDAAPAFTLPRDGGGEVSLSDFKGKPLVIFFYPRADTPGCTLEAVDFTRLKADFAKADTAVIGVSADPLKAQDKFRDKHKLATPLLSDETQGMLKAYGAWGEKSMYGKVFEGVLRTTVLVGKDGRIAQIWRGVKVDGHADAVLAAAKAL